MYSQTTATNKIVGLKKRIRAICGGTSASKTVSVLLYLIAKAQSDKTPTLTSIVSESFPHLRKGAIKDFLDIMVQHKYFKDDLWSKTEYTYTFETGSKIEFFSVDQPGKVRGPRRDRLFVNEANNIPYESFDQLEVRTKEFIILDWNPVGEYWFYTDLLNKRDDIDFITLTYKDNEALDKNIVESIEKRKGNKNWWRVYGEGQLGEVEGKIYKDWQIIDEIPHEARLERRGMDFGYSNDPTTIIDIYKYNGGFIFDERLYRKGMLNKPIADFISNLNDNQTLVVADSAEPKSIDEIRSYGINIIPALKGPGSISQGIAFVQDQRVSVTKRSVNLLKEYRNYLWKTDADGKVLNTPEEGNDHCFVYDTKITTDKGDKNIGEIKKDDLVLTRKGLCKVLKQWDNGLKQVSEYRLHLDTEVVKLRCTNNHLILTTKGWKKISQLKSGQTIFLTKNLTGKDTRYTQEKYISQEVRKECTEQYGNIQTERYKKVFKYITKTVINGTIDQVISNLSNLKNIYHYILGKRCLKIQSGSKISKEKGLKRQKSGIKALMARNGTKNMVSHLGETDNIGQSNVKCAEKNLVQDTLENQNIVITTARLKLLERGEEKIERVYDLTVEKEHEYLANGVLVHNCLDAIRYGLSGYIHQEENEEEFEDLTTDW